MALLCQSSPWLPPGEVRWQLRHGERIRVSMPLRATHVDASYSSSALREGAQQCHAFRFQVCSAHQCSYARIAAARSSKAVPTDLNTVRSPSLDLPG